METVRSSDILDHFGTRLLRDVCDDQFWLRLNDVLTELRQACGAAMAEVFLVEPNGTDMIMVACSSDDESAFLEQTRFPKGVGFPGIVLEQADELKCADLASDSRYLRTSVVEAGYCCYHCVPIVAADRFLGSLNLAWTDDEDREWGNDSSSSR